MEFLRLLEAEPVAYYGFCLLLGLLVGSFLNVIIHRLPLMMQRDWLRQCAELRGEMPEAAPRYNLVVPASACPHCQHHIGALENIPVLSYLWLRGRCKGCSAPISPRYPLIEAISAGLTCFAAVHFGFGWTAVGAILLLWALLALTAIDLDTLYLPDDITLPLLWLGLAFNSFQVFTNLQSAVLGAMFGYLSLWSVFWLFKLIRGKEGMGYGDFKLLAALGAWMGWQVLPLIIIASASVGAVVGIAMMIFRQHGRDVPIPFGPYLAGGGVVALFWGPAILRSYLTGTA